MSHPRIRDGSRATASTTVAYALLLCIVIIAGAAAIFGTGALDLDQGSPVDNTPAPTQTHSPTIVPTATTQVDTPTNTALPTPTASPSPVPTSTKSPTPTASPAPTLTPSPVSNDLYSEFVATTFGEAEVDTDLPLRIRGWSVVEGNVLIIVMNLTAQSDDDVRRSREVNTLVSSGYAQAVAHHDNGNIGGKIPDRLRIAEVNETVQSPKTLYVNTSLVREYYTGQINAMEFTNQYWKTERNMTADEEEFVRKMDMNAENGTLYDESNK